MTVGAADEDVLSSLARRLALFDRSLNATQRDEVKGLLDVTAAPERFTSLQELSNALLDALDPDTIQAQALQNAADPAAGPTDQETETARQQLVERALMPLAASPALRSFLLEREILIDETSQDEELSAGFDQDATAHARQLVESFQQFIQEHKGEITALQILFSRPYAQRRLDLEQVRRLAEQLDQRLHEADPLLMTEDVWRAYRQLEKDRVGGAGEPRILADLVSLVRHAALDEDLLPYPQRVAQRYQEWLAAQAAGGRQFSAQEWWWLDEIARYIGINVSMNVDDLNYSGFQAHGGQVAAQKLFGTQLGALLEEMNTKLGA